MQVLLCGIPNACVNAFWLVPLPPRWRPILHTSRARAGSCALKHWRRFVRPSLGGETFKSELPVVFFNLDPKKRHLHWATWWVFGSSESKVAFPKIRKSATSPKDKAAELGFTVLTSVSRWHANRELYSM